MNIYVSPGRTCMPTSSGLSFSPRPGGMCWQAAVQACCSVPQQRAHQEGLLPPSSPFLPKLTQHSLAKGPSLIPCAAFPLSLESGLDLADLSHLGSDMLFVFREWGSPSHSQLNTSSPEYFTYNNHQDHLPLRVNHWARLIMMISHLKRTKIATSCNPAHVILNHVLPYISFIFWLLS